MKLRSAQNLGRNEKCTITGRTKDPVGFVATGVIVKTDTGWDQEVILSAAAVREAGRLVGLVDPSEITPPDTDAEIERLRNAVDELKVAA